MHGINPTVVYSAYVIYVQVATGNLRKIKPIVLTLPIGLLYFGQ